MYFAAAYPFNLPKMVQNGELFVLGKLNKLHLIFTCPIVFDNTAIQWNALNVFCCCFVLVMKTNKPFNNINICMILWRLNIILKYMNGNNLKLSYAFDWCGIIYLQNILKTESLILQALLSTSGYLNVIFRFT